VAARRCGRDQCSASPLVELRGRRPAVSCRDHFFLQRCPRWFPRGRIPGSLSQLATADPAVRARAQAAVAEPLRISLDLLRRQLQPQKISIATIPRDLARDWTTDDGRARVRVLPNGDPDDTAVLRAFVAAVLAIEPNATGEAVALYESGKTVVRAFVEAGVFALSAIAVLLWIALRRIGDVLLTLVPLVIAGAVTLELCVVIGLPLNFANIIALPLLLGVGRSSLRGNRLGLATPWYSARKAPR
jgi:hypothetical protein